jgi:hypothetical protein
MNKQMFTAAAVSKRKRKLAEYQPINLGGKI